MCRLPTIIALTLASCHARTHFPSGGYPYPQYVTGKERSFYCYPVKDRMSRRDSFRHITDSFVFAAFDEPNLSLAPAASPIFRLWYSGRRNTTMITLTEDQVIAKLDTSGGSPFRYDSTAIDSVSSQRMKFIWWQYGWDYSAWPKRKHYVDSMIAADPLRNNVAWFWAVEKRTNTRDPLWHYSLIKRPIAPEQYRDFIRLLNNSQYWQMPPVYKCTKEITDGDYFSLEANTPQKYNFVSGSACPGDSSDYYKACEMMIRLAGLDKKISLIWDSKLDRHKAPLVDRDVQLEDVERSPPRHKHSKYVQNASPKLK